VRRAVFVAVVVPFAVALVAPEYWEVALRVALGALGVILAWSLSRRVWTVRAIPRELAPTRVEPSPTDWLGGAERIRHSLEVAVLHGQPDRIDRARDLRRTCRAIAAERLHAHHGIDLERDDHRDAARRLLGADVHAFLEGGAMIDPDVLAGALERL
jgi:hypothetical protein